MNISSLLFDLDDPPESTRLHRAAYDGDLALLVSAVASAQSAAAAALASSPSPSPSPSPPPSPPLTGAASGAVSVCALALNRRLSLLGATPLRLAVSGDRPACVRWLLQHGAAVDMTDMKAQTPLFVAVKEQHLECAKILLEYGADPNGSAENLSTPLSQCCQVGWLPGVQLLLMYGADPEAGVARHPSLPQSLPLYVTAVNHHLDCFLALLLSGCRPNSGPPAPPAPPPPLAISTTGDSRESLGATERESAASGGVDQCSIPHALLRHNCAIEFAELYYQFGGNMCQTDSGGRRAWEALPASPLAPRLKRLAGSPQSLFNLCRLTIRHHLHPPAAAPSSHSWPAVSCLPLPPLLRRSLLYTDTISLVQFGHTPFR